MKHLFSPLALICVALTAITFPITAMSAETSSLDHIQKIDLPGGVSIKMVKIEAGTFEMSAKDGDNKISEVPHAVTLKYDFYIGQTEVTQAQWKAVMGSNPSNYKGDDLPVETVSWNDAQEFCKKLNEMGKAPKGWKFTLPTETQWEFAARGGNKSRRYKYSGSDNVDEVAWYYGNSGDSRLDESSWNYDNRVSNNCKTHPVGKKKPNELGLYDMSGNVKEWCLDDWNEDSSKQKAEFTRNHVGSERVFRGGAWGEGSKNHRSSNRSSFEPHIKTSELGFRLALLQPNSDTTNEIITIERERIIIDLSDGAFLEMLMVEAGSFTMGAERIIAFIGGRHQATVKHDFYIGQTEVTQAQWKAVMGTTPSEFKGDDLPVENVSWNDAMEFCEKLNSTGKVPSGWKFTLPTETQWEYAAIGGKKSKGYAYSGSNNSWEVVSNDNSKTNPVGEMKANELGLYDMPGNVSEWCLDDWNVDSSKQNAEFSRGNDKNGSWRVFRGGSWNDNSTHDIPSFRGYSAFDTRSSSRGFRVVLVQTNNKESDTEKTAPKSNSVSDSDAAFILGLICIDSNKDSEAVEWFRMAAEQGHAKAQYILGLYYYEGVGVKRDRVEGVKWLRKAAEQGDKDAREALREIGY